MTPAHDPALRMALRSLLADPTYPVALRSSWIRDRLESGEPWTDDMRIALHHAAMRWSETQLERTKLAIQKALGEEIETDVVPPSLAGLEGTGETTSSTRRIPAMTNHDNGSAVQEPSAMTALFGEHELKELHIVAETMNVPPFNTPPKKHADALRACRDGRVEEPEVGIFAVEGSKKTVYTVDPNGCDCLHAQHSNKTKWGCYHAVAAEMYRRWQASLQPMLFAMAKTIDERIAAEPPSVPEETPMPEDTLIDEPWPDVALESPVVPQNAPTIAPVFQVPQVQTVTHAGMVMHEAPYSATVSVENPEGYQMLLTVRHAEGAQFFEKVAKMLAWCKQQGLTPQKRPQHRFTDTQDAPPPQSTGEVPYTPQAPPMCPYHGPMKESTKAPGTYYCSKKMGDGQTYCRERWPKAA